MFLVKAQDCAEIVDLLHVPTILDTVILFTQKQIYIYFVFCNRLLTNVGIKLVHNNKSTNDAQEIFSSFVKHYLALIFTDLDQAKPMEYISSACLGVNSQWKGSHHSFILHFQEQLQNLNGLHDPFACFNLLQGAIKPIKKLYSIQTTIERLSTTTGQMQPYNTYLSLLLNVAHAWITPFLASISAVLPTCMTSFSYNRNHLVSFFRAMGMISTTIYFACSQQIH